MVVDLRQSSPTFGRHFSILLSAEEGNQIFVPIGFAHGFLTLEPDTILSYKVSNYYSPEHDFGIRFDDPLLGIDWGFDPASIIASEKDQLLPPFTRKQNIFLECRWLPIAMPWPVRCLALRTLCAYPLRATDHTF